MQKIKSYIGKHNEEKKNDDKIIDLDEKIRRIREKNKAREKRFKEIEDDKLNASGDHNGARGSIHSIQGGHHDKDKTAHEMPGTLNMNGRKLNKGRGQRLLEMSKEPLKAKDFESKAIRSQLSQMVLEGKNQRDNGENSKECQKGIGRRGASGGTNTPNVGCNPLMDTRFSEKLKRIPHDNMAGQTHHGFNDGRKNDKESRENCHRNGPTRGPGHRQHNEQRLGTGWMPKQKKNKAMSSVDWDTEIMDIAVDEPNMGHITEELAGVTKEEIESFNHTSRGEDVDQGEPRDVVVEHTSSNKEHNVDKNVIIDLGEKSTELPDSVKADNKDNNENTAANDNSAKMEECTSEEAAVLTTGDEPSVKQVTVEKDVTKKNRPNIKVTITKNLSTTSFDEKMSMLSPLDVPKDWADCAFDDDYLEPITF